MKFDAVTIRRINNDINLNINSFTWLMIEISILQETEKTRKYLSFCKYYVPVYSATLASRLTLNKSAFVASNYILQCKPLLISTSVYYIIQFLKN